MSQLEILRPYIDERTAALVRARLLDGLKFFEGHSLRPGYTRPEAKLVLLLVQIANPKELFSADEANLIGGGSRQIHTSASKEHLTAQTPQKTARTKKRKKPSL
jgi:hypothetical protein